MMTVSNRNRLSLQAIVWCAIAGSFLPLVSLQAAELFVDNRLGSETNDGRSPVIVNEATGPVRSIQRAIVLARAGDRIIVKNNDIPYEESLSLVGGNGSGNELVKFTIEGNGAVVDGSSLVPFQAWRQVSPGLWKMTPHRKGHYQLLLPTGPIAEHRITNGEQGLAGIPAGQWGAWNGSIYFRSSEEQSPLDLPIRFASRSVGLTLYRVHDVEINNLTFRYFRLDGINAHDGCSYVRLNNVRCFGNGRAGIAAGGTSKLNIETSDLSGNRERPLLVTERAAVNVENSLLENAAP